MKKYHMKRTLFILAMAVSTIACVKKEKHLCTCYMPTGQQFKQEFEGDLASTRTQCYTLQAKWNATTAYVGTSCIIQ